MDGLSESSKLLAQLQGKPLHIPDLHPIFEHWPFAVNQHLEGLCHYIDDTLDRTIKSSSPSKLQALKSCNFGLLTSCLFPYAEWNELKVSGSFMLWIFLWDDEIDEDSSEVTQSEAKAVAFIDNSLKSAEIALGLAYESNGMKCGNIIDTNFESSSRPISTMGYFLDACEVLETELDIDQRERLFYEIRRFMESTLNEFKIRKSENMPTPAQYFELRDLTSGIYPVIAIFEFITQTKFDQSLIDDPLMKTVWKETCTLCMLINDMHSAIKELPSGSILNAVPVLCAADPEKDLAKVMKNLEGILQSSVLGFDKAASELESRLEGTEIQMQMHHYIDICRTTVTGLLTWSLATERYNLARYKDELEGITFKL